MEKTASRLVVQVLGEPALALAGLPIAGGSKKSLALFLYLAVTGRRHPRGALASLLWGGDSESARTSLRTALQRLPSELARRIDAQRETIGLAADAAIEVDAARFAAHAEDDDVAGLEAASEMYRGEFLHRFDPDATPAFDDWLLAERTRYRQLAQSVFDRLIARHRDAALRDTAAAAGARASALAAARRWLAVEPAAEGAHRWLMQLLIETGQQEAARAQYELCRRALAVAFGRAPAPETRGLYDSLAATSEATATPPALPGNLHEALVPSTPFVGRVEDLAALDGLLADPACRLLTLHGMGGSGKTRLAHVLAQQVLPRFAQGATWVALERALDADGAAFEIARALQVEAAAARQGASAAACAVLGRQQRLLVLDNVEPLVAGPDATRFVDLLLAILAAAPAVRILVTSREVLGVAEEWVYEVNGLPLPADASAAQGAAELFVQRARQAYLGFSPSAEWPHIVSICRLVDGLPLGLELAAAWVRTIPCGEIAAQLEREATALAGHANRPERQRSLDAVVAYSWQLLDAPLRADLAALSVFAGSFTHEAARAAADASLRHVSALVDKAFVQRRPDGRLALHPVIRAFAAARLRERDDGGDEVARRHAAWFVDLLQRCRARLDAPDEIRAEDELTVERAEIERAAEYCVEHGDIDRLDALAVPLLRMLVSRGAFRAADAFALRLDAVAGLGAAARAMAMTMRARALTLLGQYDNAEKEFARASSFASAHGLAYPAGYADAYALAVPFERGQVETALAGCAALAERATEWPADLRMRLAYTRGVVQDSAGMLDASEQSLREAYALARGLAAPIAIATVESQLGTLLLRRNQVAAARPLLEGALGVFERVNSQHNVARLANVLAGAALLTGDVAAAEAAARRSLRLFEDIGYVAGQSSAADSLGQALRRQGRMADARQQFERAIDVVAGTAMVFEPRYHLVDVLVRAGEARAAAQLVERMAADVASYPGHRAVVRYTLLAAARVAAPVDEARAHRWARALLADPELDPDLRAEASALAPGTEPPATDGAVDWSAVSDDVADFLGRALR